MKLRRTQITENYTIFSLFVCTLSHRIVLQHD